MSGLELRAATPADIAAIDDVVRRAFGPAEGGGAGEAVLVRRLRAEGSATGEFVAAEAGSLVGHLLFSALPIDSPRGLVDAVALAPLSVLPGRQHQGIGAALTRFGLEACRRQGRAAVVVLGHPGYYPRFGFSAAAAAHLKAPFSGPAFMALELVPGALRDAGAVHYAPAFGLDLDAAGRGP